MPSYQVTALRPSGALMCAGVEAPTGDQAVAIFLRRTWPVALGASISAACIPSVREREQASHDA